MGELFTFAGKTVTDEAYMAAGLPSLREQALWGFTVAKLMEEVPTLSAFELVARNFTNSRLAYVSYRTHEYLRIPHPEDPTNEALLAEDDEIEQWLDNRDGLAVGGSWLAEELSNHDDILDERIVDALAAGEWEGDFGLTRALLDQLVGGTSEAFAELYANSDLRQQVERARSVPDDLDWDLGGES